MLDLLAFAATLAATVFGYLTARRFVRDRLKYVDGAQGLKAPVLAGLAAAAVALPIVWILPAVGGASALFFGAAVGLGVRAGARDIRAERRLSSGSG